MAMIRCVLLCASVAYASMAWAQPPSPDPSKAFTPPVAHSADVPYPANAPAHGEPIVVTAKLTVDPTGRVTHVEIVGEAHPVFDDAVLAATRTFQFDPATYDGKPVAVEITFTHTFLPPPPPVPPPATSGGPPVNAVLRGRIIELGTRDPVSTATITATVGEHTYTAEADARGHFALPLPAGDARVSVSAPGHNAFLQREQLARSQDLAVTYLVERDRYDPYEIVVMGEQRREEVSRIALRGAEIKQVPGTFGDPFRVVQALPGVSTIVSLLPFPIVRGNSPASTAASLDGTRIPLLYHLGAGPSVVHPELIDELDFYPGGAPAPYGGYIGGVIDGRTRRARSDERLIDVDVNLLQAGAIVREPIPRLGVTATIAGRYGYPGFVLGQLSTETSLSYWDYQLRLDGGTARDGWTLFAFGARDELDIREREPTDDPGGPGPGEPPQEGMLKPALILTFHRLDLRAHRTFGALRASARAVVGYDHTLLHDADQGDTTFTSWVAEPSVRLDWQPISSLRTTLGIEGAFHRTTSKVAMNSDMSEDPFADAVLRGIGRSYVGSAFLDSLWRPSSDWLVRAGLRSDVYLDREASRTAVDPRLTVRYRLARRELDDVPPDSDDSSVWLKGSAGVYHQPPRYLLPVPGLDQLPVSNGLLRAIQTSLGIEVPLRDRFELTAEGYYNRLDPTFFELTFPKDDIVTAPYPVLLPSDQYPRRMSEDPFLDQFTVHRLGRSYGLETMLRRRASTGPYGWVSYTLSLSERRSNGRWIPYDFDRTHLFNLVAGIPLGRNWDFGLRLQYESGKPEAGLGDEVQRNTPYARFDVRFDKHAVWRSWILDFYVDITNAAVMPEEVRAGEVLRYVLPTAGVRGRF
jgi:TonB family protein